MARRTDNQDTKSSKRPAQTLDLEAEEVKEASKDQKGSEEKSSDSKSQEKLQKDPKQETTDQSKDAKSNDTSDEDVAKKQSSGGGSFFKTLAAGLIGAVLALGGQQFMPKLVTQDPAKPTLESLNEKILGLETLIESTGADELSQQVAALQEKVDNGQSAQGLLDRLDKMDALLADVAKTAETGDERIEGVAALATKMSGIEARLDQQLTDVKSSFSNELRREVTKLSKIVATQESLVQIEGVKLTAEELGKRLAMLEARSNQLVSDFAQLRGSVDGVRAGSVSKDVLEAQVQGLKAQITDIDAQMVSLKKLEQDAHETARRSALALAFSNLKRAMEQGSGFSNELEAVKRLSGEHSDLHQDFSLLEKLSNEGLTSEQSLMEAFPDLASKAIADESAVEDATAWDKLTQKARSTFRYRRTGDVKGDTSEAVLARMEHKFKQGHLEEVVSEASQLQPKAQQVIAPWLAKLKARLLVEQAMHKLEDQLLTSLQPRQD